MSNQLDEFAREIYDDARKFRLAGVIAVVVAVAAFLTLMRSDDLGWNAITTVLLVIIAVGGALVFLGDRWIRKIKKHTGVDVPHI